MKVRLPNIRANARASRPDKVANGMGLHECLPP
jgi:hypothetical protein